MSRPFRIAKRLLLPVLLLAGALVVAQVVGATPPAANFTFAVSDTTPASGCKTVSFTDTSSDTENDIQSIEWNFGDGTPVQAGTPGETTTHTYATPGTKSVTLTATDASTDPDGDGPLEPDGVETNTTTPPVSVGVSSPAPTATITSVTPNPAEPNEQLTLTGTGTDDGTFTGEWDFDGNFDTVEATGLSVNHQFATSGSKTVRFRTRDNCGQVGNVDSETVVVSNGAPIVSAFAPSATRVLRGQAVTVTATASDPGGAITLYEWDLNGNGVYGEAGDQSGAALTQVQTSFTTSGNHKVNLRVSDNSTPVRQTVVSTDVWVNFPPEADFSVNPSPPLIGDAVTFRATRANDPDGTVVGYEWDLDGNGTYEHTGATPPARTLASAGAHTASLRVTDDSGEQAVVTKTFTVGSNIRPEASFRFSPATPQVGEEVTFTSTSDDADDRIARHEWDFNFDGRYDAQGRVVTRAFKGPGKKPVVLRVTDSRGATQTTTQTLDVRRKPLKEPVDVKRSLGYIREDWGVRLVVLIVKVPARTTVKVSCKGQGCPRGTFTKRSRKKASKLRFDKLRGSVRAGGKITVISTRPGHVPAYDTYIIRGGNRSPLLREGCKPPGAKRVRALSSCSG